MCPRPVYFDLKVCHNCCAFRDLHTSLHFSFRSSPSDWYHSSSSEMSLNWKNLFPFTEPFVLVLFASLIVGGCASVGWSLVHVAPGAWNGAYAFFCSPKSWFWGSTFLPGHLSFFFLGDPQDFLAPEYTIF